MGWGGLGWSEAGVGRGGAGWGWVACTGGTKKQALASIRRRGCNESIKMKGDKLLRHCHARPPRTQNPAHNGRVATAIKITGGWQTNKQKKCGKTAIMPSLECWRDTWAACHLDCTIQKQEKWRWCRHSRVIGCTELRARNATSLYR